MNYRTLLYLVVAVAAITLVVALSRYDWVLAVAECMFMVTAVYPYRRERRCFHRGYLLLGASSSIILLALVAVDLSGVMDGCYCSNIAENWLMQLFVLPLIPFATGMMIATAIDNYTPSSLTIRWYILVAIVLSFAVSVLYMFTMGFHLWYDGYPVFNDDTRSARLGAVRILMAAPASSCVTILLSSVVIRWVLKNHSKSEFLVEVDG